MGHLFFGHPPEWDQLTHDSVFFLSEFFSFIPQLQMRRAFFLVGIYQLSRAILSRAFDRAHTSCARDN